VRLQIRIRESLAFAPAWTPPPPNPYSRKPGFRAGREAAAPLAVMFGFSTSLRSVSQGRASFSMEFSHFEQKR